MPDRGDCGREINVSNGSPLSPGEHLQFTRGKKIRCYAVMCFLHVSSVWEDDLMKLVNKIFSGHFYPHIKRRKYIFLDDNDVCYNICASTK